MKKCFITTAFGNRQKNILRLVTNIRKYSNLPIIIVTDNCINSCPSAEVYKVDIKQYPKRTNYRASDLWRVKISRQIDYDIFYYLDDDMYIVNKNFISGFDLANQFGYCAPLNPRVFVHIDDTIGADSNIHETNMLYATAYNTSPLIYRKDAGFIKSYIDMAEHNPTRSTMMLWFAAKKTGLHPYALPYEWCVCSENVGHLLGEPIILHLGHEKVRKAYEAMV